MRKNYFKTRKSVHTFFKTSSKSTDDYQSSTRNISHTTAAINFEHHQEQEPVHQQNEEKQCQTSAIEVVDSKI